MSIKTIVIPDGNIFHIWGDEEGNEIEIAPTWYEDNGTPIGDSGEDMKYLRTELILNDVCPVKEK